MAAIFKFWFLGHSLKSFGLTVTKVSAADSPDQGGQFGGICKLAS